MRKRYVIYDPVYKSYLQNWNFIDPIHSEWNNDINFAVQYQSNITLELYLEEYNLGRTVIVQQIWR